MSAGVRLRLGLQLLCVLAFIAVLTVASPRTSFSQIVPPPNTLPQAITGYAWSDTIGWISLSGSNYGLSIAPDGTIGGYAWSETIGWVSVNSTDLSGCPASPCNAKMQSDGSLTGWLKALSANGNGWDGWISLNGSNYGPSFSGGTFSGYAWGSDVVGWVSFANATASCAPLYSCSGGYVTYTNPSCHTSTVVSCTAPSYCSPGTSTCVNPPPSFTSFTATFTGTSGTSGTSSTFTASGHLQAQPTLLPASGSSTWLYWNVSNAQSCTVTGGNGDSWSGLTSGGNGVQSAPLTSQTVFTLSCTALPDAVSPFVPEGVTVNIAPVFKEL